MTNIPGADIEALAFARLVLAMPEPVALGFLRAYHNHACKCGLDGGPDGPEAGPRITLYSIRQRWAGRL